MSTKHTPGKLEVSPLTHQIIDESRHRIPLPDGKTVPSELAMANAQELVSRWNAHPDLLLERDRLREALEAIANHGRTTCWHCNGKMDIARAALNR